MWHIPWGRHTRRTHLSICPLVHSFVHHLLSTHYMPGIIQIKWEIRQTVAPVLIAVDGPDTEKY